MSIGAQTLITFSVVIGITTMICLTICGLVHLKNIDYAITKIKNRGEEL